MTKRVNYNRPYQCEPFIYIRNRDILELASELAHLRVEESGCQKIFQEDTNECLIYTNEAQDIFNEYHDIYETLIVKYFKQ